MTPDGKRKLIIEACTKVLTLEAQNMLRLGQKARSVDHALSYSRAWICIDELRLNMRKPYITPRELGAIHDLYRNKIKRFVNDIFDALQGLEQE